MADCSIPRVHLSKGILSLEDGHYSTRLKLPKVREFAVITERFNMLAGALDTRAKRTAASIANSSPSKEKSAARLPELHDEAGPCLFGITANASSIQNLAEQRPDGRSAEITRRVGEILSITERVKLLNRALLKKLRPGPLGRVKLTELLDELVVGFPATPSRHAYRRLVGKLADSYGEAMDLTLYRCIQEGIANAITAGRKALDLLRPCFSIVSVTA